MGTHGENEAGISVDEEEWVQHTLMEADRKRSIAKVLQVDCKAAVPPGNNFVSDIYRLKLKVMAGGGTIENRSVIYKTIPKPNEFKLPNIKELGLFKIEARIYMDILSQMEKILRDKEPDADTLWPMFYGVRGSYDGYLLQDLSVCGYKMSVRLKGLDFEHSSLALRGLGKFHALGAVLLEKSHLLERDVLPNCFFFRKVEETEKYEGKIIRLFADTLENKWKGEWAGYANNLKKLQTHMADDVRKVLNVEESYIRTLNHGDFWLNNILFKYDSSGSPKNIKMVDYQLSYCGSPVFDVHYFLSTTLRYNIFNKKLELLRIYYESLVEHLSLYKYNKPIPTFEEIREVYEKTKIFAIGISLTMRIFMMSPSFRELKERFKDKEVEDDLALIFLNEDEHFVGSLKQILVEGKENGFL